jgi:class 3 adenylate cyclase
MKIYQNRPRNFTRNKKLSLHIRICYTTCKSFEKLFGSRGIEFLISIVRLITGSLLNVFRHTHRSNPEEAELSDILTGWFKNFVGVGEEPNEPASDLLFPIINDLKHVDFNDETADPSTIANRTTVAGIRSPFYWRDAIQDILPAESDGLVVVFESNCTIPFTYQIDGPNVTYLGRGDLHDAKYDSMKIESLFFDLNTYAVEKSTYTGPEIESAYCPMLIRVYPSDTMAKDYLTKNPIIFTLVSVLIFLFTSLVFIAYDFKVERRQNVVMKSAVKSNAIVSSLLPSHIRDKLMSDETNAKTQGKDSGQKKQVGEVSDEPIQADAAYGIRSFLDGDGLPSTCVDKYEESDALRFPEPIADQYEETSVLAASVSGFTVWSINRDPKHIFILLEVIHSSFDAIAKQLKVLKVDAMKDCYCAVAGIPDYRKNHALVMTKLAMSIMSKMSVLTQRLTVALGREAASLKLSIGLSSGATTAGVLRSAKTRFQLFGNTVASAELLDRTGIPGRIQCSQKTASLLIEAGKGAILERRDDQAHHMETYWIKTSNSSNASRTGSTQLSSESENAGSFNASATSLPTPVNAPRGRVTPQQLAKLNSVSIDDQSPQRHANPSSSDSLANSISRSPHVLGSRVGLDPVRSTTPKSETVRRHIDAVIPRTPQPQLKTFISPEVTRPASSMEQSINESIRSGKRVLDVTRSPINPSARFTQSPSHRAAQSINNGDYGDSRSMSSNERRMTQSAFEPSQRHSNGGVDPLYRPQNHAQGPMTSFRPVPHQPNFERSAPRRQYSDDYVPPESTRPPEQRFGTSSREHSRRDMTDTSSVPEYRDNQRYYRNSAEGSNMYDEYDNGYSGNNNSQWQHDDSNFRRGSAGGGYESPKRQHRYSNDQAQYEERRHNSAPRSNMHYVNDNIREWIQSDVQRSHGIR